MHTSASEPAYDVAVVGAGPAGLAAAAAAATAGCRVVLLDAGGGAGGQFWRHRTVDGVTDDADDVLAEDGAVADKTYARLRAVVRSAVTYHAARQVWTIAATSSGFVVHIVGTHGDGELRASAVVVATGAFDRQLPFPGWDLPGVFTAGGAQALVKGHGVVPGKRIVVAGTGPFLLPVAAGLARAGADVAGVFEANRPARWAEQLLAKPGLPSLGDRRQSADITARFDLARTVAARAAEGARYVANLARHGVRVRSRHAVVAAHGTDRVDSVTVARLDDRWHVTPGSAREITCDAVAVGWGFTPQLELAVALGAATHVDADGSLVVAVDSRQHTNVPGVFAAGEVCGVGGAELAVVEGEIAGHAVANDLGFPGAAPPSLLRRRSTLLTFARSMHRVYPVHNGWRSWLNPDTLVCRCEEVSVETVRAAIDDLGASDERSVKLLTRTGMGWCQGRMCGYAVGKLAGAASGSNGNPRSSAERPLAVPVPLGVLAHDRSPIQPEEVR